MEYPFVEFANKAVVSIAFVLLYFLVYGLIPDRYVIQDGNKDIYVPIKINKPLNAAVPVLWLVVMVSFVIYF